MSDVIQLSNILKARVSLRSGKAVGPTLMLWLYDPARDHFLACSLATGELEWIDRAKLAIDTSQFVSLKKLVEHELGAAYPGQFDTDAAGDEAEGDES